MGECLIMRRGGETYKLPVLNVSYPKDVTTTVIKGKTTSATFSAVIAEAGNPATYTYQWYVNGSAVSGATSSSYTKSDLSTTATYTVYCVVSNKAGTVTTRVATLKVTQYYTPVLNTSYPANVTGATVGGSATFKVTIATAGVPASYTYQWYVNGSAVSGATSSSYTRSNLANGTYTVYCKVTNAAGTVQSRTATLTVTTLNVVPNTTSYPTSKWSTHTTNSSYAPTVTASSSSLVVEGNAYKNDGANRVYISLDVTNYSKLTIAGTIAIPNSAYGCGLEFEIGMYASATGSLAAGYYSGDTSDDKTYTIAETSYDISNLTGTYYFEVHIINTASSSSYMTESTVTLTKVQFS